MAIDVAEEVLTDPDFLISVNLKRSAVGSYVDGIFVPGSDTVTLIDVSMQPATARDWVNTPEGEREHGAMVIYSLTELLGSKTNTKFDIIQNYIGDDWKVTQSEPWGHFGYFKSMIINLGPTS